jgi:hypothetical protein
MRRFLARVLRAERALSSLPPRDPRQDLPRETVESAEDLLEALGAEPPETLEPEEAAWFERRMRPLLPRWASYAARLRYWQEPALAVHEARERREVMRRLGGASRVTPAFSANVLRAFAGLGLAEEPE